MVGIAPLWVLPGPQRGQNSNFISEPARFVKPAAFADLPGALDQPSGGSSRRGPSRPPPTVERLSSAGFAGAIDSWGEVRKGGEAPLRVLLARLRDGLVLVGPPTLAFRHGNLRRDLRRRLLAALAQELDARVDPEPRPGRNQPPHYDVLLEPLQLVHATADGRLGEDPGGLLERRGRDEAVRAQRRLRDAEEHGLGGGRALAGGERLLVLVLEGEFVHQLADHELGVPDLLDPHAPQHLP